MPFDRTPSPADDLPSLFEAWMGMTPDEWEAIGQNSSDDDEPRLF